MDLPAPLDAVGAALEAHFAQRPLRASVSFVGVDPIEVQRFEPIPGERAYVSLGMSRRPMSGADAPVVTADGPFAELMLHVRDERDEYSDVWRHLAVLAAAPAVEGVVYRVGMTVDLSQPLATGSACTGALVRESPVAAIDSSPGPVSVLQLVPATSTELAWCRVHGSEALQARWQEHGTDLLDLGRRAVDLA
ncbi:MAG TPA: suppressor of fused domain protein [Jatrophihabitans sp.]|jgi:hypothetical protein